MTTAEATAVYSIGCEAFIRTFSVHRLSFGIQPPVSFSPVVLVANEIIAAIEQRNYI
jgi:hypothetical protein